MAKQQNHTLTIALCVSLMAHGLGLSALAWWVVLTTPPPKLAAIDRDKLLIQQILRETPKAVLIAPLPPPPPPPPPPKPEKKQPPPPEKFQKPDDHFKDDSGEHDGVGTANRSNKGDKPMQAHQGYEQADLMHPNARKFDESLPTPASAGKPEDSIAGAKQPSKAEPVTPETMAKASGAEDVMKSSATVAMADDHGTRPVPMLEQRKAPGPASTGEKIQAVKEAVSRTSSPVSSGQKELAGHRAQESDTDSAAFAKVPAAVFRDGKLAGRKGLKVTTQEVRFSAVSEREWFALGYPRTVVGVRVDDQGNPQNVQVLQSSGSENVDNDRKSAVWNGFTLEPEKHKDGTVDYLWVVSME